MDLNVSKDFKKTDDDDIPVQTDSRGNMIYTCNIFHIYKGTADQVKSHMATDHSEYPYVGKIQLCVRAFKTASGLNKHSKKHEINMPTKCQNCSKTFKNKSEKHQHTYSTKPDAPSRQVLSMNCQFDCGFSHKKIRMQEAQV